MPPTSLSALAVMMPGPTIEKNMRSCRQRLGRRDSVRCTLGPLRMVARETRQRVGDLLGDDRVDRVVHGYDAEHLSLGVHDRNGEKVVAGDRGGDLFGFHLGWNADDVGLHQFV